MADPRRQFCAGPLSLALLAGSKPAAAKDKATTATVRLKRGAKGWG